MAQVDPAAQQQAVAASPLEAKYRDAVDRESAYEKLAAKVAAAPAGDAAPAGVPAPSAPAPKAAKKDESALTEVLKSPAFTSFTRSAASALGREITRSLFGTRRR